MLCELMDTAFSVGACWSRKQEEPIDNMLFFPLLNWMLGLTISMAMCAQGTGGLWV